MNKKYQVFCLLFSLALAVTLYRLKSAPLWIVIAMLPTISLFIMLQWHDWLASRPASHWTRQRALVRDFKHLLRRALALPQSIRVLVLAGCLAWCYAILVFVMPMSLGV